MDQEQTSLPTPEFIRSNKMIVLLSLIGIAFIGLGAYFLLAQKNSDRGVILEKAATDTATSSSQPANTAKITVDIEGGVKNPGVYAIAKDSRLQDGIEAAGGLSDTADKPLLAKNFNLAQKLTDGAKIYIPKVGETPPAQSAGAVQGSSNSMININTSSAAELDKLSGVGAVTAQKIIDARPYNDLNELVSKKAVSKSVFDKIKDQLSL